MNWIQNDNQNIDGVDQQPKAWQSLLNKVSFMIKCHLSSFMIKYHLWAERCFVYSCYRWNTFDLRYHIYQEINSACNSICVSWVPGIA